MAGHEERAHARIGPSSAHRWMNCPRSVAFSERFPDKTTKYAEEGTRAHEVAEQAAIARAKKLGLNFTSGTPEDTTILANADPEMVMHAEAYADYMEELITDPDDAFILIETQLDLTAIIPDSFGTADLIIVQGSRLTIVDYKYGKGVEVSAEANPQMRIYAYGAHQLVGALYEVETVQMCIFQPRKSNVSEAEEALDELDAWCRRDVAIAAAAAENDEGEYCAGTHCKFCRGAHECRALAEYCDEVTSADFMAADPNSLTDEEIAKILSRQKQIQDWLKTLETRITAEMLEGIREIPGFKVVEGRSNRRFSDPDKVAAKLLENGYERAVIFKPPELITLGAMEKMLKKKAFSELLGDLVVKPQGGPTLVPSSDKRAPYSHASDFDFEDESNEENQ